MLCALFLGVFALLFFAETPTYAQCTDNSQCSNACGTSQGSTCFLCTETCQNGTCAHGCSVCNASCYDIAEDPCVSCAPPPCTQNSCACVAPSGLNWLSPSSGSAINVGTVIDWEIGSWGVDKGKQAGCGNPSTCGYSGNGYFELRSGGVNVSSRCAEVSGNKLLTSQCTLTSVDPSWVGNSVTFSVWAYNSCDDKQISRTFNFANNEKPICDSMSVSGGSLSNGALYIDDNEPFTLTVNGSESDPYGDPSDLELCYAVRNQSNNFYQNPSSWKCFKKNSSGSNFSITKTVTELRNGYTGVPNYNGSLEDNGLVFTSNIHDNINSSNFCSTNIGYNNGAGVFLPPGGSCDGDSCILHIYSNPPELIDADPTGLTWIGTPQDSDNAPYCSDNNPMTYEGTFRDLDGSSDIDTVEFSLASDAVTLDPDPSDLGRRKWEMRVRFSSDWQGSNNTFYVRDTQTSTGTSCYRADKSLESKGPSNLWCYKLGDGHNWKNASLQSNVLLNGVLADVYYLNQDLTVYNEGHVTVIKGSSDWANSTYVAFEKNGDRVWASFLVSPQVDASNQWNGRFNNIWFVEDKLGRQDKIADIGENMIVVTDVDYYHEIGETGVDLSIPTVTVHDPQAISALRLRVPWNATDSGGAGLDSVIGEATHSDEGAASPIMDETAINDPDTPPYDPNNQNSWYKLNSHSPTSSPHLWKLANINSGSASRSEVIHIGENEEGTVQFLGEATDNACNSTQDTIDENLYLPWVITRGGHVYSQLEVGVDVKNYDPAQHNTPLSSEFTTSPFDIKKGQVEISTEFLGTGTILAANQIVNQPRTGIFTVANYTERNNLPGYWFSTLNRSLGNEIRKTPDRFTTVNFSGAITLSGNVSSVSDGSNSCSDNSKNCVVRSGSLTINGSLTCNRKTVFIVGGNLTVDADIRTDNDSNGCIFLVNDDIDFNDGAYKSSGSSIPKYDYVQGFFITDQQIKVNEVDRDRDVRDGLKVHGSLIAFGTGPENKSVVLNRSLKLIDNYLYPAEVLHHDPRYLYIAEELFGGDNEAYTREIGFKPL